MKNLLAVSALAVIAFAQSDTIKATGCVRKGIEGGCLLLVTADGKTYNIFADPRPEPGTVISIEGKLHRGVTVCQQGTPVKVDHWKATGEKCKADSGATSSTSSRPVSAARALRTYPDPRAE